MMRCRTGGGTGRNGNDKTGETAKRNRKRLRGEDRCGGGQTDKGTGHEGAEGPDGRRSDGRVTETEVTLMMELRASVTGLTRDST